MAESSLLCVIQSCQMREAELTTQVTAILSKIIENSNKQCLVSEEETTQKAAIYQYWSTATTSSSTEQDDLSALEDDYQLKLSEITSWESELETQKQTLETELQATTAYCESFKAVLKQNISSDFKYGGGGGGGAAG